MHKIFDSTIRYYKLNASQLARHCGISTATISRFRSGNVNLTTEKLESLLTAMDEIQPGSRRYFCLLLAGESPSEIRSQFRLMSATQLAETISSAADCLAEISSKPLVGTLS